MCGMRYHEAGKRTTTGELGNIWSPPTTVKSSHTIPGTFHSDPRNARAQKKGKGSPSMQNVLLDSIVLEPH